MNFRKLILLTQITITILVSASYSSVFAEELQTVTFPFANDEKIKAHELVGEIDNKVIALFNVKGTTSNRALIMGLQGTSAEILLDVTDYISDTTDLQMGGGSWVSFVQLPSSVAIILADETRNSGQVWITDGTASGTRNILFNTFPGQAIGADRLNSYNTTLFAPYRRVSDGSGTGISNIGDKILLRRSFGFSYKLSALSIDSGIIEDLVATTPLYRIEVRKLSGLTRYIVASLENTNQITLYLTDGTTLGTTQYFSEASSLTNSDGPEILEVSDGSDGASVQLFSSVNVLSDGSTAGTHQFTGSSLPGHCTQSGGPKLFQQIGDRAIYLYCDTSGNPSVWSFDLITGDYRQIINRSGIVLHLDFTLHYVWRLPSFANGRIRYLPFVRQTGSGNNEADRIIEIFRSDGTAEGTVSIGSENYLQGSELKFINADGYSLIKDAYENVVITNGNVNQTFRSKVDVAYNNVIPDAFIFPEMGDFLLDLTSDQTISDLRAALSNYISVTYFDPQHNRNRQTELFSYPQSYLDSPLSKYPDKYVFDFYTTDKYLFIPLLIYDSPTAAADQYLFFLTERDKCPNDDLKRYPGLCGCGVEESPLSIEELLGIAPRSAVCRTAKGPVLIDPDSVPEPKIEKSRQVSTNTIVNIRYPENILSQISKQIDAAASGLDVPVYLIEVNSRVSRSSRITNLLRVIRVRDNVSSPVKVRNKGKGKLDLIVRGSVRGDDQLFYEYGFQAETKDRSTILTASSLRTGELRVKRGSTKKK